MACISRRIVESQGGVAAGKGPDTNMDDYSYFTSTEGNADLSA